MTEQVQVASYKVPVLYKPGVCVIGGGAAGIAAAMGARRAGLSVLLIEKYGFCGGAAVAGLSGTICGLFTSGSKPRQMVFGFADEFYRLLQQKKGVTAPVPFGKTLLVPHDSLKWKETADALLCNVDCNILYHTYFLKAITDPEACIKYLIVKGGEGEFAVQPQYVIDASGDAEVVNSIQHPFSIGYNGVVQTPTMIFKMAHVDMPSFLKTDQEEIGHKILKAYQAGNHLLPRHHVYLFPSPNTGEVLCNMTKITFPDGTVPVGIYSKDITYAEIEGRRQARAYASFLINTFPAFRNAYMAETGVQVGIRQTRSVLGKATLRNEDVIKGNKSENAVTISAWPIELHASGSLKIAYLEDDHYDIPFETLIPESASNLLVAGRCMSAEHEALASARVTAQCFGMGYATGAACSLMLSENIKAGALTGKDVALWMRQKHLKTVYE